MSKRQELRLAELVALAYMALGIGFIAVDYTIAAGIAFIVGTIDLIIANYGLYKTEGKDG